MTPNLDSFIFLVLCCLVSETTGYIERQNDVSLEWINDFLFRISSTKCQKYSMTVIKAVSKDNEEIPLPYNKTMVMDGKSVNLILTKCNGEDSPPVNFFLNYSALVKDLECLQNSSRNVVCRWTPVAPRQNIRFFYFFLTENEVEDESSLVQLTFHPKECPSYFQEDGARAGCNLEWGGTHVYISIRGSGNRTYGNTFRVPLTFSARPPVLTWNVTKTEKAFLVNWEYPDIAANWNIRLNYTICDKAMFKDVTGGISSETVDRASHCRCCLAIRAESIKGFTPWSETKCFDTDPDALTLVCVLVVLILLTSMSLAAVALVCFRRNKDKIFPKIPQPRNLLIDISNNNFKSTLDSLYPTSKEELSGITLLAPHLYCNTKPPPS